MGEVLDLGLVAIKLVVRIDDASSKYTGKAGRFENGPKIVLFAWPITGGMYVHV